MQEPWSVPTGDGGEIAVWVEGSGPPLVMVHGSMCDHTTFAPLVETLRADVSTFALDRRGFGASADTPGYSADREFGDVAAVVDAVADRAGQAVALWGHSWGASCALGAARLTPRIRTIALYEPSLGLRYPTGVIDRIEALVEGGDDEAALVQVLVDVAGMTEEEIAALRAAPTWPQRVATAPTIAREARIEDAWDWRPEQFRGIDVPALLITGSRSPNELAEITHRAAEALPRARVHVLENHGHFAHRFEPGVVAEVLRPWLG